MKIDPQTIPQEIVDNLKPIDINLKYILGFDPGNNGSICLYNEEQIIIFPMPTLEITRNGKKRNQIDLYELARFVDKYAKDIVKAYIENPQGMPAMASNSTYRLGLNVGIAQMVIAANFIPMELVSPATWKRSMGLTKNKDDSRLKASQISPQWSHHWTKKSDDGKAESFLLAYWGSQKGTPNSL